MYRIVGLDDLNTEQKVFIALTEKAMLYRYCAVYKEMKDLRSMIVYGF